jgi:hypothetical protein
MLGRVGGAARTRGVDRRLRAGMSRHNADDRGYFDKALAEASATKVEPGQGLTGTTPLHVSDDLPAAPAVVYLTEVSHLSGDEAFCFGGGLYIDPLFPNYQVKAVVAREPRSDGAALRAVEIPPPDAIDYYG